MLLSSFVNCPAWYAGCFVFGLAVLQSHRIPDVHSLREYVLNCRPYITGNRRWLPFQAQSILNPFYISLPYEQIYAPVKASS